MNKHWIVNFYFCLMASVVLGCVLLNTACPSKDEKDYIWQGSFSRKYEDKTAKAAVVVSGNRIDKSLFPLIDAGIDRLNETAAFENYAPMTHGEFTVALFPRAPRVASPESPYGCFAPGFMIRTYGPPYDGTIWDKDPTPNAVLLCAAGMQQGGFIVVANDASHMQNIVQFEGEHLMLTRRDPKRYADTSGLHAHPIFRQQAEAGLLATAEGDKPDWTFVILELPADIEGDGFSAKKGDKVCVVLTK